jgi:hypothetical protein
MNALALLLFVTLGRLPGSPTDSLPPAGSGSLSISSQPDSAWVLLDGVKVGTTPFHADSVVAGRHVIRLVERNLGSWFAGSVQETLMVEAGQTLTRALRIPGRIMISSTPSGAEVFRGDSLLGLTPFLLPGSLPGRFTVRTLGLSPLGLSLDSTMRGNFQLNFPGGQQMPTPLPKDGSRETRLIATGAVAVVAGILAASFKIKADNAQNAYLDSRNPTTSSSANTLDLKAGISLAVMQASIFLFSWFLLQE